MRRGKSSAGGTSKSAPPLGLSAIENIVVVLQENHTFDNYFGTFPGANGIGGGSDICLPQKKGSSTLCVSPFHAPSLTPSK